MPFVAVEKIVAAIDQRRRRAILEFAESATAPPSVGRAGSSAVACARTLRSAPAADQAHGVDLVRHLIEQDAAALRGIQFLRPARTVEEIRVVPSWRSCRARRVRRLQRCARIARTAGSKAWVWPTIRWTLARSTAAMMASHSASVSAIGFSRMMCLPARRPASACARVELMRRRDIDDLDRRIVAQLADIGIGRRVEVAGERRRAAPDADRRPQRA